MHLHFTQNECTFRNVLFGRVQVKWKSFAIIRGQRSGWGGFGMAWLRLWLRFATATLKITFILNCLMIWCQDFHRFMMLWTAEHSIQSKYGAFPFGFFTTHPSRLLSRSLSFSLCSLLNLQTKFSEQHTHKTSDINAVTSFIALNSKNHSLPLLRRSSLFLSLSLVLRILFFLFLCFRWLLLVSYLFCSCPLCGVRWVEERKWLGVGVVSVIWCASDAIHFN